MRTTPLAVALLAAPALAQTCTPAWDTTFGNPGISSGYVAQLVPFDDGTGEAIYIGGSYDAIGGFGFMLLARIDPATGDVSPVGAGLNPGNVNGYVEAIAPFDTDNATLLVAAGQFAKANPNVPGTQSIAAWNGSEWIATGADLVQGNAIFAMTVGDIGAGNRLYIGGTMPTTGGVPTGGIAAWDGNAWHSVGNGIGVEGSFNPFVAAMAIFDDGNGPALYIGGRFDSVDGVPAVNLAKFDGESWSTLGDGIVPQSGFQNIEDMTVADLGDGPALYIVGATFSPGDDPGFVSCAKWDGTTLTGIGQDVGGRVTSIRAFDDGSGPNLVIGGTATPDIEYLATLDGNTWVPFAGGVGGDAVPPSNFPSVFGLGLYQGNLLVGGSFTEVGDDPLDANGIAMYTTCAACPADVNGDGELNILDFVAFQQAFVANDPAADCDDNAVFNILDFVCYQKTFIAGCG